MSPFMISWTSLVSIINGRLDTFPVLLRLRRTRHDNPVPNNQTASGSGRDYRKQPRCRPHSVAALSRITPETGPPPFDVPAICFVIFSKCPS